jgi:ATP-dependent Lon protease
MSRRARQPIDPTPSQPKSLPILAIRNRVLFPGGFLRLSIGRPNSVRLVEAAVLDAQKRKKRVVLGIFTRDNKAKKQDGQPDVFEIGTAARVVQLEKANSSQPYQYSLLVEGLSRIQLEKFEQQEPYYIAHVNWLANIGDVDGTEVKALALNLKESSRKLLDAIKVRNVPVIAKSKEFLNAISKSAPGDLADVLASNIDVPVAEKQQVLEAIDLTERMKLALALVENQLEVLSMSNKIHNKVEGKLNDTRREFYLRQQLKAIREELGEGEEGEEEDDATKLQTKLDAAKLPEEVQKVADRDLNRMKRMQPSQPEYNVIRTYLEMVADLPWNKSSVDKLDPLAAMAKLDSDHYGLEKVKKRIVEYIAVRNLKKDMKGPLLCLVGPPGVGKTSLGKSIANALNRKFARLSLGGVRDEAEIRGHRRTYIGAMAGSIIQAINRAGTNNPVILLDEMDKLGADHRGDPSAALLEVLDPAQNSTFTDHYLNLPFDLSKVFFMATANTLSTIPAPLLDRMELLQLPGYTEHEKLNIAERYLLPKQVEEHGLLSTEIVVPDDTLSRLTSGWTREAGVRNLEREIANLCRNVAVQKVEWNIAHQPAVQEGDGAQRARSDDIIDVTDAAEDEAVPEDIEEDIGAGEEQMEEEEEEEEEAVEMQPPTEPFPQVVVEPAMLDGILGQEKFMHEAALRVVAPGVATGMAWTQAGGELLFIEVGIALPRYIHTLSPVHCTLHTLACTLHTAHSHLYTTPENSLPPFTAPSVLHPLHPRWNACWVAARLS